MKLLSVRIKICCLIFCCVLFTQYTRAQYAIIPDTVFANWLQTNGYASAMIGNALDTTNPAVLNAVSMHCQLLPIRDLTGIQYFKNLDTLWCDNDSLYFIPSFPSTLVYIWCGVNNLISLPSLPQGLNTLDCESNQLTVLPALNANLVHLNLNHNKVTNIPSLPSGLLTFGCTGNLLSNLPALPQGIVNMECMQNQLTQMPALPTGLINFWCSNNLLTSLPPLPSTLIHLDIRNNQITQISALPASLNYLGCDNNQLTQLPPLPSGLTYLACPNNQLTQIPALPIGFLDLDCSYNQITSLPTLPDSLDWLDCSYNPGLTCLPQIKKIRDLEFIWTAITCLPDYGTVTDYCNPPLNSVPLCGVFNASGCTPYQTISGNAYYDVNGNCVIDSTDAGQKYLKIELYQGGVLQQQTFTGSEGFYSFLTGYGTFTMQADTSQLPFGLACPDSGYYTSVISAANNFAYNNFAFKCLPGFDLGIWSIYNNHTAARPAGIVSINNTVGDISQLGGAHCATGVGGQVTISFTGQASYIGMAQGALTPDIISGNTLTWNVADFGSINTLTAFNILLRVDTFATVGSPICVHAEVSTTVQGDYNPNNNQFDFCFPVVNSSDPNEKEVYPIGNVSAGDWLTYTIHFQNTGTASALNIYVKDTLDNNLDLSTVQLLAFSHKNTTQVIGHVITFNFPSINLADSSVSDSASRGFVQFKVRVKNNIAPGTTISNTAYIYFDFNAPVITNTVTNTIPLVLNVNRPGQDGLSMQLLPNPTHDICIIKLVGDGENYNALITDITGKEIMPLFNNLQATTFNFSTATLSAGLYFVRVSDTKGKSQVCKLVKE